MKQSNSSNPITIPQCCLCQSCPSLQNPPHIVPSCEHIVCDRCINKAFKTKVSSVMCKFCSNVEKILQNDVEQFPKDIKLIRMLKLKHSESIQTEKTVISNGNQNQVSDKVQVDHGLQRQNLHNHYDNHGRLQEEKPSHSSSPKSLQMDIKRCLIGSSEMSICQTHKKQMEIICIDHKVKLCPMCAVFGNHKNHQLRTIQETNQLIETSAKQYQAIRERKELIYGRLWNAEFRKTIAEKMESCVEVIRSKIKEGFEEIYDTVKHAEKNAHEDLSAQFRKATQMINTLMEEKSEFDGYFQDWDHGFAEGIEKLKNQKTGFEQKISIIYDTTFKSLKEGSFYTSQIESFNEGKMLKLQKIPQVVKFQQSNDTMTKDIYNWIKINFRPEDALGEDDILISRAQSSTEKFGNQNLGLKKEVASFNSNSHEKKWEQGSNRQLALKRQLLDKQSQKTTGVTTAKIVSPNKRPLKVEFSNPQNFLSPGSGRADKYVRGKSPSPSRKKSPSIPKASNPTKNSREKLKTQSSRKINSNSNLPKQPIQELNSEDAVKVFCNTVNLETLDLSSFELIDEEMLQLLHYVWQRKKIKCLKISNNRLSNEGFVRLLPYLGSTTNINVASNDLTEEVLNYVIKWREKVPSLRILNMAHNRANERKAKSLMDELKRVGIIVTLT